MSIGNGLWWKSSGAQSVSKDAGFFSNFISMQKMGAGWHFVLELRRNYLRSCNCFPDYRMTKTGLATLQHLTFDYTTSTTVVMFVKRTSVDLKQRRAV